MIINYLFMVLSFFIKFVSTANETAYVPPPSNVSLDGLLMKLTWSPPEGLTCRKLKYEVVRKINGEERTFIRSELYYENDDMTPENGVNYTVKTLCDDVPSKPIQMPWTPPQNWVKDFQCYCYSDGRMNCTWQPVNQSADLCLYYKYGRSPLRECRVYLYAGAEKMGCHLQEEENLLDYSVLLLANGTRQASPEKNVFLQIIKDHVKPPPPKLKITKDNGDLVLTWNSPNFRALHCWSYNYTYSKCKETVNKTLVKPSPESPSARIPYDSACRYRVKVRAVFDESCGQGKSDWSTEVAYGQDRDPDWSMNVAAVVVPATATFFVVVALVLFRRYKDIIFPDIPDPASVLKDMFANSKEQTSSEKLYVAVEDRVESKIQILSPE